MLPKKRKALKNKADRIFSLMIRSVGYCELEGIDSIRCGGVLQCAHIETRGAHAIRWNPLNAICICAGHHVYYTHHPREWDILIETEFPDKWKFVEEHRRDIWDKDIEGVLASLMQNDLVTPS